MITKFSLEGAQHLQAVAYSAVCAFVWAMILIGYGSGQEQSRYFSIVGNAAVWAPVFLSLAVLQTASIIFRALFRQTRVSCLLDISLSLGAAMFWTFITSLMICSGQWIAPVLAPMTAIVVGMWYDFMGYETKYLHRQRQAPEVKGEVKGEAKNSGRIAA